MDSSSFGIMCGDWGVGLGVIVDGRLEGVSIVVELVNIGSM